MSRNRTLQLRRAWRVLTASLKYILIAAISIVSVLFVACLLADVAILLKGKEIGGEWWQVDYDYSLLGIGFWAVAFPLASGSLLRFIKRKLSRENNLPYWIGGFLSLICYCVLGILVALFGRQDIPVCSFVVHLIEVLITQ